MRGKGEGESPGGRVGTGFSSLRVLNVGAQGGLRKGPQLNIHQLFQVDPFRVLFSTDWSTSGQRFISRSSWSWCYLPGFAAFLSLELKYN